MAGLRPLSLGRADLLQRGNPALGTLQPTASRELHPRESPDPSGSPGTEPFPNPGFTGWLRLRLPLCCSLVLAAGIWGVGGGSALTWVWVSPSCAASSARSGSARYCAFWKRRCRAASW